MITYQQHKANAAKRIEEVPMYFAFNNEQFEAVLEKLGNPEMNELCSIGAGGIMRKTEKHLLREAFDANEAELAEVKANEKEMIAAIVYELGNYEYCITYDPTNTIEALGLDLDDGDIAEMFAKAEKQYWADMQEMRDREDQ